MNTEELTLRKHPRLESMFKEAESRFLNDNELKLYLEVYPEGKSKADASNEIKAVANQVVKKVITRIYELYPYEQFHEMAMPKCVRDVRYVVAYAVESMLMNDPDWFRDKLLIWLKTILQSFEYPDLREGTTERYHNDPETKAHVESLKPHQRSIYETYLGVKKEMQAVLSEEAYSEVEIYLDMPISCLPHQ